MSSFFGQTYLYLRGLQKSSANTIQKRFSTRESIHRYVEPDKFKKHMLAACEPYTKKRYVKQSDSCVGTNQKIQELDPLNRILAEELFQAVKSNDFVLFIQHNYTPFQSERVYKNTLIKAGGLFYSHRNSVYKEVFQKLGMDRLTHLFVTRNSLVLGPLNKLTACVKALNRMPQFMLLAGCIEDGIYEYDQLQRICKTPDLDLCRATLTSILETPAFELAENLEVYVKEYGSDGDDSNKLAPLP